MRVCKNSLWKAKKYKEQELKDRVIYLQKEVSKLKKTIYDLEHRITQLEIARKLGN